MFAKLLKHEWKANGGLLSILSAGALGAGLLGALVLRLLIYLQKQNAQQDTFGLGTFGLSSALTFIFIALVAYGFAVQFINLFRFYKNKFTDEGYLTFTLPVTASQIFLSSLVSTLFWLVVSALVLLAAAAMIVFIGAAVPLKEHSWEIRVMLESIMGSWEGETANEPGYRLFAVLQNVSGVITAVYTVVLLMTSIVVGCVLAKKHKILATIGSYYVINFAVGITESILGVIAVIVLGINESMYNDYTSALVLNVTMILTMMLRIGLGVGGYFLSVHLMKNKLNLP